MSIQPRRVSRPHRRLVSRSGALVAAATVVAGCSSGASSGGPTTTTLPVLPANSAIGQPIAATGARLTAVSCSTATRCWAVGTAATPVALAASPLTIERTTNGGATWVPQAAPVSATTDLDGVSCVGQSFCLAVGYAQGSVATTGAVYVTSNAGASWQAVAVPSGALALDDVVCTTSASCIALATNGNGWFAATTTNAGVAWTVAGSLPAGFAAPGALSCPAAGECLVAGYTVSSPGHGAGMVAVTTDDGAAWTAPALPSGVGLLHGISCATPQDCLAVGTTSTGTLSVTVGTPAVVTTADAGQTWTSGAPPSGIGDAFAASCPDTSHCAVVGTKMTGTPAIPVGAAATTSDAAATWRSPVLRYLPVGLTALDCPTSRLCIAVGGDELARLSFPTPKTHGNAAG